MSNSVLRYQVPIDDVWHEISSTQPLHVAARRDGTVEFWALNLGQQYIREYRVFGTGHALEDGSVHVGTTFDAATTALVWHLFSRKVKE